MNKQTMNIFLTGIIFLLFQGHILSQEYRISGTINGLEEEKSTIYIYLLTEETFEKPYTGIRTIKIETRKDQSSVNFRINDVKKGLYGIRCFQDLNENGKLDRFLFFPKEPWTLSWKNNKKRVPPDFEDISFEMNRNIKLQLYLSD